MEISVNDGDETVINFQRAKVYVFSDSGCFQHIYHIGCVFNLHSIISSGVILGGHKNQAKDSESLPNSKMCQNRA